MLMRERIIAEIRRCAEKLGRAPSQAEFRKHCTISWHQVYKHFRGMRAAARAAGLEPGPKGGPLNEQALVLDWARVVRELARLPSRAEYDARGKHHSVTLHARIGWHQMAHRFVLLVREFHIEQEWEDVVEIVWNKYPLLKQHLPRRHGDTEENRFAIELRSREFTRMEMNRGMRLGKMVAVALAIEILIAASVRTSAAKAGDSTVFAAGMNACSTLAEQGESYGKQTGPPVYGEPLGLAAMAHAPTNEDGVLFLFGALAAELGFRIERVQREFPDVEAKREVAPGRWELQLWEVEMYSRNFKEHRHDPTKCHGIVCWKHNWPDVPEGLEVIELSKAIHRKPGQVG
jgi:hypothetical protein